MSGGPRALEAVRLEKAAVDSGFDRELLPVGGWLAYASTGCPLRLWLGVAAGGGYTAAFSQRNVMRALAGQGVPATGALPAGAAGGLTVPDVPGLDRLLRRAYQLGRTLPDELLHAFQKQASALPRATEAERLVVQRMGQDVFRRGLLDYWEGRCAITGLDVPELLRASHIKPWADCATDAERLDVHNGLLLSPHLDAAFDRGFLTLDDAGSVVISPILSLDARRLLGLDAPLHLLGLRDEHHAYLAWHRVHVFKSATKA